MREIKDNSFDHKIVLLSPGAGEDWPGSLAEVKDREGELAVQKLLVKSRDSCRRELLCVVGVVHAGQAGNEAELGKEPLAQELYWIELQQGQDVTDLEDLWQWGLEFQDVLLDLGMNRWDVGDPLELEAMNCQED